MNATIETILKEILINGLIVGVIGGTLAAFCRENVNVLRKTLLISSARKKLKTGDPKRIRRGVQMLLEVAVARPFRRCGMEFLKLDNVKISYSPLDSRPTIMEECPLAGSNLDKASILPGSPERPQLHIIRSPDIERPVVEWLRQKGVRME